MYSMTKKEAEAGAAREDLPDYGKTPVGKENIKLQKI